MRSTRRIRRRRRSRGESEDAPLPHEDAIADRVAAFLHRSGFRTLDAAQPSVAAARDRPTSCPGDCYAIVTSRRQEVAAGAGITTQATEGEGISLKMRLLLASCCVVALLIGTSLVTSAQTAGPTRIIKVTMVSYKYDPS